MADKQSFLMKCSMDHMWIETYPTEHTLFGVCPRCPGNTQGRVLKLFKQDEEPTISTEEES